MHPEVVDTIVASAVALRRARRFDESSRQFEQALEHNPLHPGALASYAMLRLETGDFAGAIALGRRAIAADPERMSAYHVLGQSLCRKGEWNEGIAHLRRALSLSADAFEVQFHLGNALLDVGDLGAAEEHLLRARDLAPDVAAVAISVGNLYQRRGDAVRAIDSYRCAVELDPQLPQAHNNVGNVLLEGGDADSAIIEFRQALALAADRPGTWSNLLLALNRSARVSGDELIAEHRAFGRHFGERIAPLLPTRMPPLDGRRLRIGYISSDFTNHAVALFFEPLLAHHERAAFEISCFHTSRGADEMTQRLQALAEHFTIVAGMSDRDLAQCIRDADIDILIDLNGHTAGNRLPVLQHRPAPIQVTWLGYLGTTGLSTVDYRFTDARADPPGLTDHLHTETLWRLPDTAWCYQPYPLAPEVAPLPMRSNGHVTFASTNNAAKISTAIVELWAQILGMIPDARLVMIGSSFAPRARELDAIFAAHGVALDRIERLPRLSTAEYLALHHRVDMALDSWPCAGGTTTCDALWMGVPVVTLAGERSFSRSGASLLASVGLEELVAHTSHDYVSVAVSLARDPMRLAGLRESLRDRMRSSPLTDARRFARSIEAAYMAMARRHLQQS